MGGEYAERAIGVIDKLAELNNLHANKQCEKEEDLKNAAAKARNSLKAFKSFNQ